LTTGLFVTDVSGAKLTGSSASLSAPLDVRHRAGSVHSIDSSVQSTDSDMAMRHLFDQVIHFMEFLKYTNNLKAPKVVDIQMHSLAYT